MKRFVSRLSKTGSETRSFQGSETMPRPATRHLRAERRDEAQRERDEQEATARGAPAAPGVEADDQERRQAEVDALLGQVAEEPARDAAEERPAGDRQLRRDDEVREVGVEDGEPAVVRPLDAAGEQVVEKRRDQDGGERVGAGERREQRPQPRAPRGGDDVGGERARAASRSVSVKATSVEKRTWKASRSPSRQPRPPPRSSPSRKRRIDERDERQQEDGAEVEVAAVAVLGDQVAREPVEVTADERGPERPRQIAAEQVRRPGRERRHQDGGDVVGDDRAGEDRQRREERAPGREPSSTRRG